MSNKKVALVGPSFFSYVEAIVSQLSKCGIESKFFDERHSNSMVVKVLYRIGYYNYVALKKRKHLKKISDSIIDFGFTDVLLIDVEVVDATFVESIKSAGIRVHIYMWDSADNKPRYTKYLDMLDGKASFDPVDCNKLKLKYIPLFSESVFAENRIDLSNRKSNEIFFCGTLHSDRAVWLNQLKDLSIAKGIRTRFMLYYHSKMLFLIRCIFRSENYSLINYVSYKGYPKSVVAEATKKAKFVFDIPHPGQRGLTARTFEVLRAGSVLITRNKFATNLPYTLSNRVICFENFEDLSKKMDEFNLAVSPLTPQEDYFLSIARFVDQIIELIE